MVHIGLGLRRALAGALLMLIGLVPDTLPAQPFDIHQARRSVVRVIADRGNSIGSGIIIKVDGKKGYVLTAYHVIQTDVENDVTNVKVELFTEEQVTARISPRRVDLHNDLAVLVLEDLPAPLPSMPWGKSADLYETMLVFALGHSVGGPGWLVTEGVVSRLLGGMVYFSGHAVNPGNSGGPLLNSQGELVGLNMRLSSGLGRALEADVVRLLIRRWVPGLQQTASGSDQEGKVLNQETKLAELASIILGRDGKEMILVSAGWFEMGSTDKAIEVAVELGKKYDSQTKKSWFKNEYPRHRVWLDAFYMDKYEVTVGEYKAFIQATKRRPLSAEVKLYAPEENYPVVYVSWDDATAYCQWFKKALPTEAQWEKAARGGNAQRYPWGNQKVNSERANYCDAKCKLSWKDGREDDGYQYTAPVGSYEQNVSPYGIHDLAGNVWEWVQDWFDEAYYGRSPERNPVNRH